MPNENNKILKYNPGEISMKAPFIIYSNLESLLEKISTCHNNPKKSSATKINKHTASGYSLFSHCSYDAKKSKLDYYSGNNCIKTFYKDLKKHATKIINFEKKDIIPLSYEETESYFKQKILSHMQKNFFFLILIIAVKICI